jgi:hypothetical protein
MVGSQLFHAPCLLKTQHLPHLRYAQACTCTDVFVKNNKCSSGTQAYLIADDLHQLMIPQRQALLPAQRGRVLHVVATTMSRQ